MCNIGDKKGFETALSSIHYRSAENKPLAAQHKVPAVSMISSTMMATHPSTEPTNSMEAIWLGTCRRLFITANSLFSPLRSRYCRKLSARSTPKIGGMNRISCLLHPHTIWKQSYRQHNGTCARENPFPRGSTKGSDNSNREQKQTSSIWGHDHHLQVSKRLLQKVVLENDGPVQVVHRAVKEALDLTAERDRSG